jgi:hypothetical protein
MASCVPGFVRTFAPPRRVLLFLEGGPMMTDLFAEVSAHDTRLATRCAMLELAELLTDEFVAVYPAGHVIRRTYRTRETLLAQGLRLGVVEATAIATRRILRDPAQELERTPRVRVGR